ncbi:MAG: OmpA family protein [Bacteroidota bacterium]
MTFPHRWTFLAALFNLIFVPDSVGQTSDQPLMAGLSGIFVDYQGPISGDFTQARTFSPGIQIGAHAFLNKAMNLSINSGFVPEVQYPRSVDDFINTSLIDVNGMVQFKSNGTIFSEDAFFAPYLSLGFGLNTASNNLRFYIPAALGMRFRINSHFSLQMESMYKQRLGAGFQPVVHSAGFVFSLPAQKKPVKKTARTRPTRSSRPQLAQNKDITLPDRDNDGVPDRDDLCPDEKGLRMYLGCPATNNKEKKQGIAAAKETSDQAQPTEIPVGPASGFAVQDENHQENAFRLTDSQATQNTSSGVSAEDAAFITDAMGYIHFENASIDLKDESFSTLDEIAELLQKYPNHDLQVMGHTDATGTDRQNIILSKQRAFKVKYYLVYEKGVSLSRIHSDGYSSTEPIDSNESVEGRQRNRRVEFRLIPKQ